MADQTSINADKPREKKEEDRFQRYEFSKRIAYLLDGYKAEHSLVIGLYGKWGEGKTSVMNFIKNELSENTIKIDFNPWLFNDQEHLLRAFFAEIAKALKKNIAKTKENIGKLLDDYGELLGSVKIAGFGLSGLSNYGKKLKEVTVEELKKRVDAIVKESGKKIVVFVDDIDRLDVKEIQYIFKLIKLVGDFYNTSYVLSFDDELVAKALAPLYGDGEKNTGYLCWSGFVIQDRLFRGFIIPGVYNAFLADYKSACIKVRDCKSGLTRHKRTLVVKWNSKFGLHDENSTTESVLINCKLSTL